VLWLLVGGYGCASGAASAASRPAPAPKPAAKVAAQEPPPPTPEASASTLAAVAPPPAAPEPAALPDTVEGPDIPRAALLLVLEQGVGRFLQKISIEPHLERGRFVGWRILELFPGEPELSRGLLMPGDTLLRVNGQSVERPEQFKNVWDSLATESQLVLQVLRAGKASEVRHRIVQATTSVAGGGSSRAGGAAKPGPALPRALSKPAARPPSGMR
jgi:hypothetical protein